MKTLVAFFSGLLFGVGLFISGMTQPTKVVGFLDLFGEWDPSLAFVMMGAILVHGLSYRFILKRSSPFLDTKFHIPTRKDISAKLLVGSVFFGVGWGLVGLCPGPAIVGLTGGSDYILTFMAAMLCGIGVHRLIFANSKTTHATK